MQVAEGLLALAYFCTGAENVSTMIYYLTLAHRMLVALNQTRSPIYLRTTIALAGYAHSSSSPMACATLWAPATNNGLGGGQR